MKNWITAVFLAVSTTGCGYIGFPVHTVTPQFRIKMTRANLEAVAVALDELHNFTGTLPSTRGVLTPLSQVGGNELVDGGFLWRIPVDGWGNPIRFWSDGSQFALVSAGPNARYDLEYGEKARALSNAGLGPLCELILPPSNDDVLVVNGEHCGYQPVASHQ